MSGKDKTVTLSLRISEDAYKALQEDAKKQNASINTIANQILQEYAHYDRYLKRYGMLKVSTKLFNQLVNAASDEAIVEIARDSGEGVVHSLALASYGEVTVSGILDWLKRVGTYSNLNDYSEVSQRGRTTVTLTHKLGPKASLYMVYYLESLFRAAGKEIKVTQLRDSVTFEV